MRLAWVLLALVGCGGAASSTTLDGSGAPTRDGSIAPVSTTEGDAASVDDLATHEPDLGTTPKGSAPSIVQYAIHESAKAPPPYTATAPFENDSTVTFSKATKAGDSIWVAATVSDYGGIHTISVSDTQKNKYTLLDQENDGQPGAQTVAHFWAHAIAGDSKTPDVITVDWGADNYKGVLAVELSDVSALVGHNGIIADSVKKSGAVTSPVMNVTSVPALLVSLSMSTDGGGSDTGGNGCAGAAAASGYTSVTTTWNWSTVDLATLETKAIDANGSVMASYTAPCDGPYVTVSAVFQ